MIAVRTTDLGKAYRLLAGPADRLRALVSSGAGRTIWALQGVNLELAAGDALGIVGDNGAGKTTLLRLLAGSTPATTGLVERFVPMSAMLNLGAGFHPDLTGAENVRIGCAVRGLSPADTERLLPRIAAFSELGHVFDRPVRTYSSGMYLRLGFAVATAHDPGCLIVDEHLSVGDQHFRRKCIRRVTELRTTGSALVLCSHDLHQIREVCERTLWIHDGRPAMMGPTDDVLRTYVDHARQRDGDETVDSAPAFATADRSARSADTVIESVELTGDIENGIVQTGRSLTVRVVARMPPAMAGEGVHVGVLIVRNDAVWCYGTSSRSSTICPFEPIGDGRFETRLEFKPLGLLSGKYALSVALMPTSGPHIYDSWTGVAPFSVRHETPDAGIAMLTHRWSSGDRNE